MIVQADSLVIPLADKSVHCCVTSPPYWGLRDYGVEGQVGLEATPTEYVAKMVAVFREVRRVLRDDGVCFVNLGDSYATGAGRVGACPGGGERGERFKGYRGTHDDSNSGKHAYRMGEGGFTQPNRMPIVGLKPKDLIGIPWLVAFALRDDGWYLRQDIVWHKPNPMPESVTDRCTKGHEYVFLLTKKPRYYWDTEAIAENVTGNAHSRGNGVNPKAKWKTPDGWDTSKGAGGHGSYHRSGREKGKVKQNESFTAAIREVVNKRNKRSVWTIPLQAFSEAHFATFPEKLVEPCIAAGTSDKGCCAACGAPWVRVVERSPNKLGLKKGGHREVGRDTRLRKRTNDPIISKTGRTGPATTIGWRPSCTCDAGTMPCTVLDPFAGSCTTGVVALKMGRRFVGLELKRDYIAMGLRRMRESVGLFMGLNFVSSCLCGEKT